MKKISLLAIVASAALIAPATYAQDNAGDTAGDTGNTAGDTGDITGTPTSFEELVSSRMPGKEVSPFSSFGSMGVAQLMFSLNCPSSFEINRGCAEDATLSRGEDIIGRIPAANDDTEAYACAIFGVASMEADRPASRAMGAAGDDSGLIDPIISMSVGFKFGDDPITDEGNYTMTIPDGYFLVGGVPVAGATYAYHIGSYWSCEPANGAEEVPLSAMKAITITYKAPSIKQGHCKTVWGYDYTDAKYHITYAGEDCSSLYSTSISGNTVTFKLKPGYQFAARSGRATVSVDYGYFLYGNEDDALFPVSFSFTVGAKAEDVTSVTAPESDASMSSGAADVWSLQGVRLMSGASREEIQLLPAGIYIVDGRKIMVK